MPWNREGPLYNVKARWFVADHAGTNATAQTAAAACLDFALSTNGLSANQTVLQLVLGHPLVILAQKICHGTVKTCSTRCRHAGSSLITQARITPSLQTAAAVAMLVFHKTNAHHRRHANSRLVLWYSQVILQLQVVLVPVLVKSIYRVASVVVVVNLIYWCAWRSTLGGEKIIKNLTRCFKSRLFGVLY
jgi:hypothetical protein